MAAAAIGGYSYYQEQQVDPIIRENIEALTQNEGGGGRNCYVSATEGYVYTGIYCGTCKEETHPKGGSGTCSLN